MPTDIDAEALRESFQRSHSHELATRIFFPFYPAPYADPPISLRSIPRSDPHDKTPLRELVSQQLGKLGSLDEWMCFPDDKEIASLFSTKPFYLKPKVGPREVSLFHAGIMIGERIRGGATSLLFRMSDMFIGAILAGELDPRHPITGIKFSDHKADDLVLPDLAWRLYPEELQAFALKTWGLPVYTDAELKGEPSSTAPSTKPLGSLERNTLLAIIAGLATEAKADISHPEAAGVTIAKMIDAIGASVDSGTIARHLKKIPEALETRKK